MKSSRIISVVFVVAIAIIGFWQLPEQNIEDSELNESVVEVVESAQQQSEIENQQSSQVVEVDSKASQESPVNKPTPKTVVKKPYESDWCDGRELSENDIILAQTELKDWLTVIGKAAVKSHEDARPHELSNYVAPYESLSIERLKELALQGDKWAMVTFMQDSRVTYPEGTKVQEQVANELLIEGASYYAIYRLVLNSFTNARINIDKNRSDLAKENITDALAYVYWGLEHFNGGGLGMFLVIAKSDEFKGKLSLEEILKDSTSEINDKITKLTNRINQQRMLRGIEFPEPPVVARNVFAGDIAYWQHKNDKQMELLRSLDIAQNVNIAITDCVKKHQVFWDKVSK